MVDYRGPAPRGGDAIDGALKAVGLDNIFRFADHARAEGAENRGAGTRLYLLRRGKRRHRLGQLDTDEVPAVCP